MNDVDFNTLMEIMKATSKNEKTQQTGSSSSNPPKWGVDPGNEPVMSLFDFAKQ